jgi:hypothetical protein
MTGEGSGRGVAVLADGVQAAFAAGALERLANEGVRWRRGQAAGLGAQLAVLALLGEADEGARRWRRQAELSCPLLASRLDEARRRLGESPGMLVLPDPWTLSGWLDRSVLGEHLAPEAAAVPDRLAAAKATCSVLVEDLASGRREWEALESLEADDASRLLLAAASFPGGWGAVGEPPDRWGGVGLLAGTAREWAEACTAWDVVCGFPVPAARRAEVGATLVEAVQRRDELAAGGEVAAWAAGALGVPVRVLAPAQDTWLEFEERESADLGLEYPLPWERNGELAGRLVRYGAFAAEVVLRRDSGRARSARRP